MTPRQTIEEWLAAFNRACKNTRKSLYAPQAIHQKMPLQAIQGKAAIGKMFRGEFAVAPGMHYIPPAQLIEEGDPAVPEWRRDIKVANGCGFFEVKDGLVHIQRGYGDRLAFNKLL